MNYLKFEKDQLVNLEYSLRREIVRTNRAGAYASTTLVGCNTRRYHGLFVVPQPHLDNDNHVLLSAMDESIVQRDEQFNLGIHRFKNENYEPKGHKYLRELNTDPYPKFTYRVGGVVLTKERLFVEYDDRILIKYTLVEAQSETKLIFKPYLAFRNIHELTCANNYADRSFSEAKNGVAIKMYDGYDPLFMQFSKSGNYIHKPDWYYNIEYLKELERGYEYLEDLYVPGTFEFNIKKGESIIFSAGLDEIKPSSLKSKFLSETNIRIPRNSYIHTLQNAAEQFLIKRKDEHQVIAGYHWYGKWGRDTFISLPGLTLVNGRENQFLEIMDTMTQKMHGVQFPNKSIGMKTSYNAVDTSLWFIWAVQKYIEHTGKEMFAWEKFGDIMKQILYGYRDGRIYGVHVTGEGLLRTTDQHNALTWMDAFVDGQAVTSRMGMPVEVNSLWYNALSFVSKLAQDNDDVPFLTDWEPLIESLSEAFVREFWNEDKQCLFDYIDGLRKNDQIRPNQVFACSLQYSPLSENQKRMILHRIRKELLCPRGLRTLSPIDDEYKGSYIGDIKQRDLAYHQGSVFPWLLGAFVEGYLKIHGRSALHFVKEIFNDFESELSIHGLGTISELFDGDPPHHPRGAISQAWSVAELLRIDWIIKRYEEGQ
ncbi:MAG: glycogen debranching enzyme family protein [Bacteroidales bacterium]|nr:glycogen debranching enzyme family protein [Bacteroidales bacterium]